MDYEFDGLPLHVLLIHFVVIIVPLAALCTVLAAAWPAARRRLGIVTPIIALAALIAVPITTQAGEWLLARVANTQLIAAHAALGRTLLPWAIATFVVAALQWFWFRFVSAPDAKFGSRPPGKAGRLVITLALAAAVAVSAVGSVVTVVRIGDSGSRALWTGSFTQNPK
jgi:hypothetical protein